MSLLHRCAKSPACWFGGLILGGGLAANLGSGLGAADTPSQDLQSQTADKSAEEKILREGTRIENRSVEVRQEADRVLIYLDGAGIPLTALENLAMQRILLAIIDDPADKNWTVTGSVTEFQGRNFLLLERVTRAPK